MPIAHPWAQLYQYAYPGPRCDCVATLGLTNAFMPTLALGMPLCPPWA